MIIRTDKDKDGSGFMFVEGDGDKEPLIIMDGIEVSREEMKKLSPTKIERIDVIKGDKAIEEYGAKGKDGVIRIVTKKD